MKLQTMRCLFEAYEHVLALLEGVFTPMFCHSDEVSGGPGRGARSSRQSEPANRPVSSTSDTC